jgi:glycosyltransferase involved in cell wall biosynthesis
VATKKIKIAVYSIALNEEQFVEQWYQSAKEADYLLIADTGSSDRTVELAKSLGINVVEISIKPWRFDDARNASLAVIPSDIDYCIALDLDEVLLPGWREELEKSFKAKATRPRYKYTWNWNLDGSPGLQYGGDKIHSRHGYRWKHPVHEVMMSDRIEQVEHWTGLEIHHHADNSKPRSQYLNILAQSVKEDPYSDRNSFYYARELFFYNQHKQSTEEFKRYLALPTSKWLPERAAAHRYLALVDKENAEDWNLKAISQDPTRRESYVQTAEYYYNHQRWEECLKYAELALNFTEKPLDYFCEPWGWDFRAYDYAAIAAFWLGKTELALTYGEKAIEITPTDERLQRNLEFYKEKDGTNGSDSI